MAVKLIKLPDGEHEESHYQSEDGRFTVEGPYWKKNDGYGNEWTVTDTRRFMIDWRPRFGYAAVIQSVRACGTLADCRERIGLILGGEASGEAETNDWYHYATREQAQAAIDSRRDEQRRMHLDFANRKRREERCRMAALASDTIRETAARKADALDKAVEDARKALWRAEEAQRRLRVVAEAI